MKNFPENLRVIEYEDDLFHNVAMYNSTVINTEEVERLIKTGMLGFEYNSKVVVMTKTQYKNLFDKDDTFYTDLRLEQQGGIQ